MCSVVAVVVIHWRSVYACVCMFNVVLCFAFYVVIVDDDDDVTVVV